MVIVRTEERSVSIPSSIGRRVSGHEKMRGAMIASHKLIDSTRACSTMVNSRLTRPDPEFGLSATDANGLAGIAVAFRVADTVDSVYGMISSITRTIGAGKPPPLPE